MTWLLDLGIRVQVENAREVTYLLKLSPPDIFIDWCSHSLKNLYLIVVCAWNFARLGSNQFNNFCGIMRTNEFQCSFFFFLLATDWTLGFLITWSSLAFISLVLMNCLHAWNLTKTSSTVHTGLIIQIPIQLNWYSKKFIVYKLRTLYSLNHSTASPTLGRELFFSYLGEQRSEIYYFWILAASKEQNL